MAYRFITALILMLFATAASAAEVRLRSSVACSAPIVRLIDVAEVRADDARIAAALAEIPLCPAPAAGSQRSLSQQEIRQLLTLSGVEQTAAQVTGSETITVLGESATGVSLAARRPLVATGIRQAAFEADVNTSHTQPQARSAPKPPAAHTADAKELAAPPLVARGTIVTVHARTAGVKVTTSGKALEAGVAGETVGVELTDNKQRVVARVTGPQTVEVAVDGSATAPLRPAVSKPAVTTSAANP